MTYRLIAHWYRRCPAPKFWCHDHDEELGEYTA